MADDPFYLGCPSWGFKDWRGNLYQRDSKAAEYLAQYASVFNAVEGNTTFYSLPGPDSVLRWKEAVPGSFRFCFKLPRWITHDKGLVDVGADVREFFHRLEPLGETLGPFMVQLPASLGPGRLEVLDAFLASLPRDHRYAVELRNRAFFRPPLAEKVQELFEGHGAGRVVLDTRGLAAGDQEHPDVLAARHPKPRLPVDPAVTGGLPFLRFVGHPEHPVNDPWLDEWAETLAGWLREGLTPYVFLHCPNDLHAPPLARILFDRLQRRLPAELTLPPMPPWPGEEEPPEPEQLQLF